MNILEMLSAKTMYLYKKDGMIFPTDQGGIYPLQKEWEEIKQKIDLFYAAYDEDEISQHNEAIINGDFNRASAVKDSPKKDAAGYVYLIHHNGLYKIGRTTKLTKRLTQISPKMPHEVTLIYSVYTENTFELESMLHQRYADKRMNGEWFSLTQEDIKEITEGTY